MRSRRVVLTAAIGITLSFVASPMPSEAGPRLEVPTPGYWLAGADGGVFTFNAPFYGSGVPTPGSPGACSFSPQPPSMLSGALGCSAIAATPSGNGYWLLNAYRWATAYGQAGMPSQSGCVGVSENTGAWSGIASSLSGAGFLLVSSNGRDATDYNAGVISCGDAQHYGGVGPMTLNGPVVGIVGTPDGNGYWLVGADGGVFAFGDAVFVGSMGGMSINAPIVGITPTPDGKGYWLAASDGGVFSFGDASFAGSMGGTRINAPVVGIAGTPDGKGYWLAAADGGVFSFGTAPFEGSVGGKSIASPIVGIAAYRGSVPS
jgi:hypothetical protein